MILVLIISIQSFGQNPANYQYRVVYERLRGLMPDSVLHIPRYNGVPSGLRGGSATHDGAIAFDTLNGHIYGYRNSAWFRLANYSELATGSRFGVEDIRATQTRNFSGAGTHPFTLDSLSQLNINFDPGNGLILTDYVNGIDRLRINTVAGSRLFSQNGSNEVSTNDGRAMLLVGTNDSILLSSASGKVYIPNIPYHDGAGIVHLGLDTVASSPTFNKLVRKTAGSGSTPTLQQVLTAGSTLTTSNTIISGANDFNITGNNSFGFQVSPSAATFQVGFSGTQYDIDAINGILNLKIAGTSYLTVDQSNTVHNFGRISSTVPHVLIDEANDIITLNDAVLKLSDKSTPSTPASTFGYLYVNTDSLRFKNDAGTVFTLGTSGGSGGFDITSQDNFQHYLDKVSSVYGAFYWVSSGTGSAVQGFTTSAAPLGFLSAHELKTGTTTTGLACHYTQQAGTYAAIALSSAIRYNFHARVQIPVVSDGTETFEYYAGFMDDITGSANIVDGVYFTYTHSASSGQWVCHTENNNTKTSTASGITMTAAQNYDLKISVFGGSAYFYIDDVLVVTTATNVPDDDTNRITSIGDCIIKSAGTTSRSVYVDVLAYGRRTN